MFLAHVANVARHITRCNNCYYLNHAHPPDGHRVNGLLVFTDEQSPHYSCNTLQALQYLFYSLCSGWDYNPNPEWYRMTRVAGFVVGTDGGAS